MTYIVLKAPLNSSQQTNQWKTCEKESTLRRSYGRSKSCSFYGTTLR